MSVYKGDRPSWLRECLASLQTQRRPADQIVIVLDGPIGQEQTELLANFGSSLPILLVPLEKNVGLGSALKAGLSQCAFEYVARMDADDICVPERFEKQLSFLERRPEIDILGAWIGEFDDTQPEKIYAFRKVPESNEEILKAARRRNPFNHMTVVFRRSAVERVGSYRPVRGLEDYDLWVRVLRANGVGWNLQEALVWARAGSSLAKRRGGGSYLAREYMLLFDFYRSGFIGASDLAVGLTLRTLVRLAPQSFRALAYRAIRSYGLYR